jgi:hypothetical protein
MNPRRAIGIVIFTVFVAFWAAWASSPLALDDAAAALQTWPRK